MTFLCLKWFDSSPWPGITFYLLGDSADRRAHSGGYKAADDEYYQNRQLGRCDRQQEVCNTLCAASADNTHKYACQHKYNEHCIILIRLELAIVDLLAEVDNTLEEVHYIKEGIELKFGVTDTHYHVYDFLLTFE